MALLIQKLFASQQLPTTAAAIYTVPSTASTYTLKNGRARLTNTSASTVTVTLYINSAAAVNCFLSAYSLGGGQSYEVDIPTMTAGDSLQGACSAATSVTIHEMGGVLYS